MELTSWLAIFVLALVFIAVYMILSYVFKINILQDLERIFAEHHLQILNFSRKISKIRSDDVWLGYVLRLANGC